MNPETVAIWILTAIIGLIIVYLQPLARWMRDLGRADRAPDAWVKEIHDPSLRAMAREQADEWKKRADTGQRLRSEWYDELMREDLKHESTEDLILEARALIKTFNTVIAELGIAGRKISWSLQGHYLGNPSGSIGEPSDENPHPQIHVEDWPVTLDIQVPVNESEQHAEQFVALEKKLADSDARRED